MDYCCIPPVILHIVVAGFQDQMDEFQILLRKEDNEKTIHNC